MSIILESKSDTPEQVQAAMAGKQPEVKTDEGNKPEPPAEKPEGESTDKKGPEASETSEKEGKEKPPESEGEKPEGKEGESDEEEKPTEVEKDKDGKKGKALSRRIKKLTSKLSAKDERIEYLERELALKGREPEGKPADKPETPQPNKAVADGAPVEPDPDDFESVAEFNKAKREYDDKVIDWKVDQKLKARDTANKQTQAKDEFNTALEKHKERMDAYAEEHEDFEELMDEVSDLPMPLSVQELIITSENGPAILHALIKDPSECERIAKLSPLAAAREIGRVESALSKPSQKTGREETTTSKAPPPPSTLSGKSGKSGHKTIYDEDISQADYERLRREQRRDSWGA